MVESNSDDIEIAGTTWGKLKESVFEEGYKSMAWYLPLNETEKQIIEELREAEYDAYMLMRKQKMEAEAEAIIDVDMKDEEEAE